MGRKKYNPELHTWRGISHKKAYKRIRRLKENERSPPNATNL